MAFEGTITYCNFDVDALKMCNLLNDLGTYKNTFRVSAINCNISLTKLQIILYTVSFFLSF